MSNRPVRKKVVEITQEDFDVEWTPPPRTGRDRIIQIGVLFLIVCFLLPAITCAVAPDSAPASPEQQAQAANPIDASIRQYAEQLAKNPEDATILANLGFYTNQKAQELMLSGGDDTERMTLLATAEKYLRDALSKDAEYSFATVQLAENLMMQGKNDEADALVSSAMATVEPKLASEDEKEANDAKSQKISLLTLAVRSDMQAGKFDDALAKTEEAISLKPGEPALYIGRADVHNSMGNKDLARKDLEMVVDIGQKTGNQRMVQFGQQMIEQLDNPPSLEVISVKETDITPTPGPE